MKNNYKDYLNLWAQNKIQKFISLLLNFPLSIISRIIPKGEFAIYGSMNGFKICDNSKYLFLNTFNSKSFFITKNKNLIHNDKKNIVYAYSLKGLYLQFRAKRVYWSHGLNDFISSLVVGSKVTGLQHGLPGKKPKKLSKIVSYYKIKNFFFPYMNNDFCHDVWSPRSIYDPYIKEAFYPLDVNILRKQIPRIEFNSKVKRSRKILYAPSHRDFRSFIEVIKKNKITEEDFFNQLKEKKIKFVMRPHPKDHAELLTSNLNLPCDVDTSEDIHDSLASYSAVVSDFSGLLIDCWEMNIETFCLCDDLENIFEREIIFDWFYERLKTIRIYNMEEILKKDFF